MRKKHAVRRRARARRSVPDRADMIAALGLEPEGKTRGSKYNFSTAEFWKKIRTGQSNAVVKARLKLGVKEP
jgi:hypothetical protein